MALGGVASDVVTDYVSFPKHGWALVKLAMVIQWRDHVSAGFRCGLGRVEGGHPWKQSRR